MQNENDIFLREEQHLREVIDIAQGQLDQAVADHGKQTEALQAIQEERTEENLMDIGGLDSAQGFLDLMESSQSMHALGQVKSEQAATEQNIRRLARMLDVPYFARIDFRPEGGDVRCVYIGRSTLMEEDTMQIHVYDWRVPIASVFYQYGVGPAQYEAPAGVIEGEVLVKRQYEIQHGKLLYCFDADTQVLDHFLREMLSRPAAPAMKSIVETIQRDQDRVIRDLQTGLLMVQGAAGSGKTSVALHRVAYLMYTGLQKNRLSPGNILILAPNATFERYIAQVLPDLGEQQVQTMLLEELLSAVLSQADIQPRSAWVETWLRQQDPAEKTRMKRARNFKRSQGFLQLLDRFVAELPRKWIPFCDIDYDGQCIQTRALSQVTICNGRKKVPLAIQLRMLERAIWASIRTLRPARQEKLIAFTRRFPQHMEEVRAFARMLSIRESGALSQTIQTFTRIDCRALYRALFASKADFLRLSRGILPADEAEVIRQATLAQLDATEIAYDDAAAIAYLHARTHGCRTFSHIRQVVVDEAQDLDRLQMALLDMLFPSARYTMLGDVNQSLLGPVGMSLYEDMQTALHQPQSLLVTLDKSFRFTREIWAFSAQFLPPDAAGTCFSRSGEKPRIHHMEDQEAMDAMLLSQATVHLAAGHQSVALVCKTQHDAERLYARLKGRADITLIDVDAPSKTQGLVIVSLYMAKGLEFDAVLLCDVDAAHYADEDDKGLLYVGCTRALHVLELFYTGERSPLLQEEEA